LPELLFLIIATFSSLFDFPDLSDGQSELSSPPNSNESVASERSKDKEDPWYNLPSNLEDKDNNSVAPSFTLPIRPPPVTSTAFTMPKIARKEYSTGARIKAIYILKEKKLADQIKDATRVSRSRAYAFAIVARERGWRENKNILLEVYHVLNQPRSRRPAISSDVIKYALAIVLQNSTTRGFSYAIIAKEVRKRGHKVALRTIWKVLTAAGYSQCKLIVKPGLNKQSKKERYEWYKAREHWGIKEWKNVIFTDETAVQLGGTRGKRRVWRLPGEAYNKHYIRRR
jgi:hypothetical protein